MKKENGDPQQAGIFAPEELIEKDGRWLLRHLNRHSSWTDPRGSVPALDKGLRVLAFINHQDNAASSLAEIASALGITRSHCHSILKTLVAHDWLFFDVKTKRYRLNAGILRDLSGILSNGDHVTYIRPFLERICRKTGAPTVITRVLPDDSFVVIDRVNAPQEMELTYPIGHLFPRDAPVQMRANLAWRPDDEITAWLAGWQPIRYSRHTLVDPEVVHRELMATRERGYARTFGEFTDGLMAMAVPVFETNGSVKYILTCISTRMSLETKEAEVAEHLIAAAAGIHTIFGATVPRGFPMPNGAHDDALSFEP